VARTRVYQSQSVIVDYEPARGPEGIAGIAMSRPVAGACRELVERKALPYAISISPRSTKQHQHYADSFFVEEGTTVIAAMRRVALLLVNDSDHAAAVEWGNEQTPDPHRVLGRTLAYLNHAH
jgi:hypothetical protein